MSDKVGVRFRTCGKIYYFSDNNIEISKGDCVVVESSFGMTIGRVVTDKVPVESDDRELKKIIRKATSDDICCKQNNVDLEKDARAFCLERIRIRGLQMKLVCTEATLDKKRIIFYFTADGRIDFRELVKDLASKFKTRIEMRQIGVRDETKLIGGLGICGREVCCNTFLTGFAPISIKMAKKQELVLNTSKLSGLCGRLMCCLNYEFDENASRRKARGNGDEAEEIEELVDEIVEPDIDGGAPLPEGPECEVPGETAEEPSEEVKQPPQPQGEPQQKTETSGTGEDQKRRSKRRNRKFRKRKKKKKGSEQKGPEQKGPEQS